MDVLQCLFPYSFHAQALSASLISIFSCSKQTTNQFDDRVTGPGLAPPRGHDDGENKMKIRIGDILTELDKEQRYSMKELSKKTKVPASTLGEWSNNRTPKNPVQVQKVAQELGVSMHYLLFGEEDHEEPLAKIMKEEFFSGTFEVTVKKVKLPRK